MVTSLGDRNFFGLVLNFRDHHTCCQHLEHYHVAHGCDSRTLNGKWFWNDRILSQTEKKINPSIKLWPEWLSPLLGPEPIQATGEDRRHIGSFPMVRADRWHSGSYGFHSTYCKCHRWFCVWTQSSHRLRRSASYGHVNGVFYSTNQSCLPNTWI